MHIFTEILRFSKSYNFIKFSSLPKTFNSKPIGETIIPNVMPSFIHKKLGILRIDGHINEIINKDNEIEKKIYALELSEVKKNNYIIIVYFINFLIIVIICLFQIKLFF